MNYPTSTLQAVHFERLFLCSRYSIWIVGLLFFACSVQAAEQSDGFQSVRFFLANHSRVSYPVSQEPIEWEIVTHLEKYSGDKYILIYERRDYVSGSDRQPETSQMITYTFTLGDLDLSSLHTLSIPASSDSPPFWMVEIHIGQEKEFVGYKNYMDRYVEGNAAHRSTSEGKSRKISLGYFGTQEQSQEFVSHFKSWFESVIHPAQ